MPFKKQPDDLPPPPLAKPVKKIIRTLNEHFPTDKKEIQDIKLIIEMCHAHPNIFSAQCKVGHITGSALIIEPISRRLLLHYHVAFNKWLQFGGHAEGETLPYKIAYREAIEETSLTDIVLFPNEQDPKPLDVDVHTIKKRGDQPQHYHFDFRYLFLTKHPEAVKISAESSKHKWINIDDIDTIELDYALRRLILKAKQALYE